MANEEVGHYALEGAMDNRDEGARQGTILGLFEEKGGRKVMVMRGTANFSVFNAVGWGIMMATV